MKTNIEASMHFRGLSLAATALACCVALAPRAAWSGPSSGDGGDIKHGQAVYAVCGACHGMNGEGNKDLNAPRIAGQEPWELVRQLENFKAGVRAYDPKDTTGAQMKAIAATLPDEQAIKDVVAYIGTLKAPKPAATVKGDVAAGAATYAVCAACHGPQGEGNKDQNAPRLAGQHDWYIVRELKDFQQGLRGSGGPRGSGPGDQFGPIMAPMAMTLPDDAAVDNVAAYIATLKD